MSHDYIYEWIGVHLDYNEQARTTYVIGGLQHLFG